MTTSLYMFLGHRLSGYLVSEHRTMNVLECSLHCLQKSSTCRSINYRAQGRQDLFKNCHLNNATKATHPQNLQLDENFDYYESIENEGEKVNIKNYYMCKTL